MLNHLEINVSNLATSKVFYTLLLSELGYVSFQTWEQGFSFKKDNFYLVFVQTEAKYLDKPYHRKNVGLNHLAFSVLNKQTVNDLRLKLIAFGVEELYPAQFPYAGGPQHYAMYFEDPDRVKIEIVAQPC
ncbi:VOC family protein [Periweissella beninensis]|uniref:VOC domain-containing protein n=1 Tax=Periweissella beninensis TaxID=504936 RepID=A0ABT0VH55_9LACO|nr:VOC family protein [Periweissella beninensis]MBM7544869.1 catechol 2,3-dioxygenase-like lactoylglutathione lyase family enzyme [Periweissella beninensis]MCM2437130.1 hypothetical protein [Periweissella beninensis]MCT4396901.1 hypothetical protein [Periweissella beninensis]